MRAAAVLIGALAMLLLADTSQAGSKSRSNYRVKYKGKGKCKGHACYPREEKQQVPVIINMPQQQPQPLYRPYYVPYHVPAPHRPYQQQYHTPPQPYHPPAQAKAETKTVYVPVVKTVKVPVIIREKVHYVHTHHKAAPKAKGHGGYMDSYGSTNSLPSPSSYSKDKFYRRTSEPEDPSFVETFAGGNSFEREFVEAYLKSKTSEYKGTY